MLTKDSSQYSQLMGKQVRRIRNFKIDSSPQHNYYTKIKSENVAVIKVQLQVAHLLASKAIY